MGLYVLNIDTCSLISSNDRKHFISNEIFHFSLYFFVASWKDVLQENIRKTWDIMYRVTNTYCLKQSNPLLEHKDRIN